MLRPPDGSMSLELILGMGSWGSGKTTAWATWAYWMWRTKAESKCFVISTDRPMSKLFDTWDGLSDVVKVWPDPYSTVEGYEHLMEGIEWCKKGIVPRRNDLTVIDLIGSTWDMSQDYYSRRVYGEDLTEFAIQKRAEYQAYLDKALQAKAEGSREKIRGEAPALGGDHGKDWGEINRMYRRFTGELLRLGSHVFACAGVDTVRDTDNLPQEFKRLGEKPKGQKDLGHFFDTTLKFAQLGEQWKMSTVRETTGPSRKRERLEGVTVSEPDKGGFVSSYLMKVAGWKI